MEPDVVQIVADELEHLQVESALEGDAVRVNLERAIAGNGARVLKMSLFERTRVNTRYAFQTFILR